MKKCFKLVTEGGYTLPENFESVNGAIRFLYMREGLDNQKYFIVQQTVSNHVRVLNDFEVSLMADFCPTM